MRVFFSPEYEVTLPGHVWPTSKYRLIKERCESALPGLIVEEPRPSSWEELGLVHTSEYLGKLRDNTLNPQEIAQLELPWRPEFVDAFRLMVGGTCAATAAALEDGRAMHLGGGLHHAFASHGEGFCPLNDVAVAIRFLQSDRRLTRAAVVDLDVHHGNGTAMIFERDASVFTFSMHQQLNYPLFKPASDLDIGLEDGADDDRYLSALRGALPRVLASAPALVVYLAGADPFEHDQIGGLRLTKAGLRERDRLVIDASRRAGVPLATVLAGGYAKNIRDTVDIHVGTIELLHTEVR